MTEPHSKCRQMRPSQIGRMACHLSGQSFGLKHSRSAYRYVDLIYMPHMASAKPISAVVYACVPPNVLVYSLAS